MTETNQDLIIYKSKTTMVVAPSLKHPIELTVLYDDNDKVLRVSVNDNNHETSHWVRGCFSFVNMLLAKETSMEVIITELCSIMGHNENYYVPNSKGLFATSILSHIGHTLKKII